MTSYGAEKLNAISKKTWHILIDTGGCISTNPIPNLPNYYLGAPLPFIPNFPHTRGFPAASALPLSPGAGINRRGLRNIGRKKKVINLRDVTIQISIHFEL
jgi:hypothetical protein